MSYVGRTRYRAERNFGLLVGGVLSALSLWWLYRGRFPHVSKFVLGFGILLIAAGGIVPRLLVWPNRAWMGIADALSFVMTRVILGAVFFVTVTPLGLVKRATGWDPLRRRSKPASSYWSPYPARQRDTKHYEKMY